MRFFIIALLLLFTSKPVPAASTVACHCFQERTYQPQQSHAADPYFLATTQNSLLASYYGIDKRSVVKAKMSGADGNDLWIAHELARRGEVPVEKLKRTRAEAGNWQAAVTLLRLAPRLDAELIELLGQPAVLAAWIIDDLLVTALQVDPAVLLQLRQLGADSQQRLLAVLLGSSGDSDPHTVFQRHVVGSSWGELLHKQGFYDGVAIERAWRELLSK